MVIEFKHACTAFSYTLFTPGQQRAPLLIQPHSGYILHEAIKVDAEFLAKSNIMDYSYVSSAYTPVIDSIRH